MNAIISILPDPFYQQVERIWETLDNECGLKGIQAAPYPHFSWQGAQEYEEQGLELTLKTMAGLSKPFQVKTCGIGIFSGDKPVIFINIIKSQTLMRIHQQIWAGTRLLGKSFNPYYEPESWQPHISLAMEDLTPETLATAVRAISKINLYWTFAINNFAYFSSVAQGGSIKYQFTFRA